MGPADELLAAAAELIEGCGCDGGCPACTGPRLEPGIDARALALRLLVELGRATGALRSPGRGTTSPSLTPATIAVATDGAGRPLEASRQVELPHAPARPGVLAAERLARTVGGEVVSMAGRPCRPLHDRPAGDPCSIALAWPVCRVSRRPEVPLVCLDTETTGLATATGTVAFLVGLGWWEGDAFHQVQLLLPDHADEPALLDALAAYIPLDGWLVTYNGRGFDWPLLVTRYRMARRAPPIHGGHLDLLRLSAESSVTG